MKKLIACLYSVMIVGVCMGQITNQSPRSSFVQQKSNITIPVIEMPSFDLQKQLTEDVANDLQGGKPYRFGYEFEVDVDPSNSGIWQELPNGDSLWKITFTSKGALTLNFIFDVFELVEGQEVYVYNQDKSFVLGAYTSKMNNKYKSLGTWIADGDTITLEYYVPAHTSGQGKLHIGSVVHGYRSVPNFKTLEKGLNESRPCNLDVNCDVGEDFNALRDQLKKSVALILNNGISWCTGTLINNTSNDRAPYLLTANHCAGEENLWSFRFNWVSSNTVCAQFEPSQDNGEENYYQVTGGAKVLAKNEESDVELIEILGGLDEEWDLEWAGWDRTDNFPEYVVSIHHPRGDLMKISRDDSPVEKKRQNSGGGTPFAETWDITVEGQGWELGVTEGGSSGGALFDQNGRIIGQLYGGSAACIGLFDNARSDFFGRFAISWSTGRTKETRLAEWLDPTNKGCLVLNMLSEELEGKNACDEIDVVNPATAAVILFPNPTTGTMIAANTKNKEFEYVVVNMYGTRVLEGVLNAQQKNLDLSSVATGIYFVELKEMATGKITSDKIVVASY